MFSQHVPRKLKPLDWIFRILALIAAAGVFYLGVRLILLLGDQMSVRQKREVQEMSEKRMDFENKLGMVVHQAGFEKKGAGGSPLFVPALVIELSNSSDRAFESIEAYVDFSMQGQVICRGRGAVRSIGPDEVRGLVLKCVDATAFGAMAYGIKSHQLGEEVGYRLHLRFEGVDFAVRTGVLDSSPWKTEGKAP